MNEPVQLCTNEDQQVRLMRLCESLSEAVLRPWTPATRAHLGQLARLISEAAPRA